MSYDGFEIEIYGTQKVSQSRLIEVVKALPIPQSVWGHMDHNDLRVAKGEIPMFMPLNNPTKEQVVEFFSDESIYRALGGTHLNFGYEELPRGDIKVWIAPHFVENAAEIYGQTDLAPELKKRKMQSRRQVASIKHGGGEEGELDRRVFDYGKIVAEVLIQGDVEKYALILTDFHEGHSVATRDEFLGQLERLIEQNCAHQ